MTLLCVLALNVTSATADPYTIANGSEPSVAVDEEGTAHVVWNHVTPDDQADVLHYCQVPRGATSYQHEQSFTPPEALPRGEAFDTTGRALNGRVLTWSSGATVFGHGRLIMAAALAPGRRRLTLTARGPGGGTARAGLVVRITPARPRFRVLRASIRVGAKAKSAVVAVATTFTTSLTARRLHVTVGRTPRRVAIPIKPSHSGLQLTLKLGTGRLASRQTVLISRS